MTKKTLEDLDFNDFCRQLTKEPDRACAILGGSLVEEKLKAAFKRRIRSNQNELFNSNGALATFSSRIRLAHALGWIDDSTQDDLHTIRDIRNKFAHSFDHEFSFEDQSVSAKCRNLHAGQAYIEGFELAANAPDQQLGRVMLMGWKANAEKPRQRYEMTVIFLVQQIDEITADIPTYKGTDLIADVRQLSAALKMKVNATGVVASPPVQTTE